MANSKDDRSRGKRLALTRGVISSEPFVIALAESLSSTLTPSRGRTVSSRDIRCALFHFLDVPRSTTPLRVLCRLHPDPDWSQFTVFQRRVYQVTCAIPRGEVRTYGWVAQQIGNPRAARAVGQALNVNPYPGPIPCHRVVGANGKLVGYALGLNKKRAILKTEGVIL